MSVKQPIRYSKSREQVTTCVGGNLRSNLLNGEVNDLKDRRASIESNPSGYGNLQMSRWRRAFDTASDLECTCSFS